MFPLFEKVGAALDLNDLPIPIPKPEWPCWLLKERDSPEGRPGGCGFVPSPHHLLQQMLPAGAVSEPKQVILSP